MNSELKLALASSSVSVFRAAAKKWRMSNSLAYTCCPLEVQELFQDEHLRAFAEKGKISVNFIHVFGPRPIGERLHYHTATIVGIVTAGEGFVDHEIAGKCITEPVHERDVIIIPRGALHTFHCLAGQTVDYAVLEIGPDVDGQAHHYEDDHSGH